jgi:hypothetical protein
MNSISDEIGNKLVDILCSLCHTKLTENDFNTANVLQWKNLIEVPCHISCWIQEHK